MLNISSPFPQTLESIIPDVLAVSMSAQNLVEGLPWFTNSTLVAIVVLAIVLISFRKATKNMQLVPSGFQNLFEALIELLYNNVEDIVGPKVAKQCFHLILTIFVYVLISNWFGLLPGVGTICLENAGKENSTISSLSRIPPSTTRPPMPFNFAA